MIRFVTSIILLMLFLSAGPAFSKTPPEIMEPYKKYRAALKKDDVKTAQKFAFEAWQASEEVLGDNKLTGDLAINYADLNPKKGTKNPFKDYERRAKAFKRSVELASLYEEDADVTEIDRRLRLAELELLVRRYRNSGLTNRSNRTRTVIGKLSAIEDAGEAIEKFDKKGSTFDADYHILTSRYYLANGSEKKAVEYAKKAKEIYQARADNYVSKYRYFTPIFLGDSLSQDDQKIEAALEYQGLMQNLEGALPAEHPLIKEALKRWMLTRSELEDAGRLPEAEEKGLCECWPYENYKNKPLPLARVPPKMPTGARRSGHAYAQFDIDAKGTPENIRIVSSTNKKFEKPSVQAIRKWQYSKLAEDADPKFRKDIPVKIIFRLADERGNIIPETRQ